MQKRNNGATGLSYAWIILGVLFIGHVASFGMRSSFQAYISPWELEFSINRSMATTISMISFIVFAISQPFTGKLNDYFGKGIVPVIGMFLVGVSLLLTSRATQIWQVFLTYSVGFSIGVAGSTNAVVSAIITNWFEKRRGLALGLVMSGLAVGQLILVPVNLLVIDNMGWRTAMLAMGALIVVVVGPLFAILLRTKPEDKGMKPYGYEDSGGIADGSVGAGEVEASVGAGEAGVSGGEAPVVVLPDARKSVPITGLFRKKIFWLLTIPYFICGFTDVGIVHTHLTPMTQGRGIPTTTIAVVISLMAVANIAGTIITGYLADHFNRKRQLAVIYAFRGITFIFLIVINQPWLLMVFAILFGAVEMASIAPTNSLTVQMFGEYSPGVVLGVVAVSHQLGGAVGSWIPGVLFDMTGSYSTILILSCVILIVGALLVMLIPGYDKQ